MFSAVFMKILEMRPKSYDRRMDRLTSGRNQAIKNEIMYAVPSGAKVLEIGCGTGQLAEMLANGRHTTVDGFDTNPLMIEQAQRRITESELKNSVTARCMGVADMDSIPDDSYDATVAALVFSELSMDERRYALQHARRALKTDGLLVIADEVIPRKKFRRLLQVLYRTPLLALTYLVSGKTTHPVSDLTGEITDAGFQVEQETRSAGDAFAIVTARSTDINTSTTETVTL